LKEGGIKLIIIIFFTFDSKYFFFISFSRRIEDCFYWFGIATGSVAIPFIIYKRNLLF
jgi:hypothetical protein